MSLRYQYVDQVEMLPVHAAGVFSVFAESHAILGTFQ